MTNVTKAFVLFACFILIKLDATAQTNIKIILKTDLRIDSVDAFDISSKEFYSFRYRDTLNIHFAYQNIDLFNIRYFEKGKMYRQQIWLDTGNIVIKAHTDSKNLVIDTVLNSPTYYRVANYLRPSKKAVTTQDTLERNAFLLGEIEKNIENPRSLAIATDYVNFNQNSKTNLLKLKILLATQKTDFSWFRFYPMAVDRMNSLLAIKKLNLSDFKFVNRKNEIAGIALNQYDYYILDFWFVGCVPCMEQHKQIKNMYLKLRDKKVGIVGISTDRDFNSWNKYLAGHGYNWDNYKQSGDNTLSDFLGIHACRC